MGSVMVDAMAGSNLAAEPKKLHPFFTAPKISQQDAEASSSATTATEPVDCPGTHHEPQEEICEMEEPADCAPKRKKRKTAEEADESWEDAKKPKRGRKKTDTQAASIMNHFSKLNGELNMAEASHQSAAPAENTVWKEEKVVAMPTMVQVTATATQMEGAAREDVDSGQSLKDINSVGPPKRMLQLNPKIGTIGSPPKLKEIKTPKPPKQSEDATENKKTPTPKGERGSTGSVKIKYGTGDASRKRIGAKIDEILNESISPTLKRKARSKTSTRDLRKAQATDPNMSEESSKKETHPFFTGKAKKAAAATPTSTADPVTEAVAPKPDPAPIRPRIFSSTPCSPRKRRTAAPSVPFPQFGMKSLGLRTPGARLPAWPPRDMMHVRGGGDAFVPQRLPQEPLAARKSKGNITHVAPAEMILNNFATTLRIPEALDAVRSIDTETFSPPPLGLRLAEKHFESGVKLQKRVLREVKNAQHPALAQLRATLVSALSAFDKYQCESVCWAQKYHPTSAADILQYGKEAFLLRDWLQALKVQSVDTGEVKVKPAKPPKKKRKKNKLDSFIVDSDEEADDMDEVSSPEEDWSPDRHGVKKTVIRAGDMLARDSKIPTRLTNTVVISGPHGCGKTSAVYAIAKELDFEVFEINSGSRRSGKDVLEKIGDMTRNHLVQHHQADVSATAINEEEVAEDIKSGKQATMNTFFKAQAASQPAKKKKPTDRAAAAPVKPKPEPKKMPAKNQRQSLILLDEVDILYEEDKQFWNTVISLIVQSKRPFIMTCNDENLVPLHTLTLHGIFRFSAPPADLAVDRLLIISACEGHALRRNAIEALFDARQQDMRACLMDLNYWCQIAVGDQRGGLDWFYPRWPKGCDIDEDGNVVRVISQDTYVEGMGWLAHDLVSQEADEGRSEEELLDEARDFWQMDAGNWHESLDLASWAAQLDAGSQDRLSVLENYEDFTDAMSIADLSSAMAYTMSLEEPVDCTLPEITEKAREDYVLGRQLIDAPVASTFDPLATSLPTTLKCLARKTLQASTPGTPSPKLKALDEASIISQIRQYATATFDTAPATREDFSIAFDVLATSDKTTSSVTSYLDPSVFDGTMRNIALDVAPYVRSIVAFETELQKQRQKLSSLVSQGGKKRMRNTRASHAALEGGSRSTTRRDKWFNSDLNSILVMRTGGNGWADVAREEKLGSETGSGDSALSSLNPMVGRARQVIRNGCDDEETGSSSDGKAD